jgi:hypothetical protein
VLLSAPKVIISDVDVKEWHAATPSVDRVRPSRCPRCGAAARPVGEPLGLWGHGTRKRLCVGPLRFGDAPDRLTVAVRRFLCRRCKRTCTVVPRGVCPGRIYLLGTIVWALALWALSADEPSAAAVRGRISPLKKSPHQPARRDWAQLRRWAKAADLTGGLAPKGRAGRIAGIYVGRSPPSTRHSSLTQRAFLGAIRQPF